jgi:hypothetical protein
MMKISAFTAVLLCTLVARADGPGHFGKTWSGDAIVAAWSGCRKTAAQQPWAQEFGAKSTRGTALYCSCVTDAIRVLNPRVIDSSSNLVLPNSKQATSCLQDVQARLQRNDQAPKGYFGIEKRDMPTENVVAGWFSCVQAMPGDDRRSSRQCGCVADAMRANLRYPYRNDPTENQRAGPNAEQQRVCAAL